uniref:Potassium channel domain-containing protein n=1 Tax=Plectus sambesii TaxID=2011161 RepID=A0A914WTZ0_9BILA
MGALIFYHIEAGAEMEEIVKLEMKAELPVQPPNHHFDKISDIARMMAVKYHSDREVVEALLKDFVVELKWKGLEIKEYIAPKEPEKTEIKRKWDFPSSFLFAFTVLTTIGYGNIAPATDYGKVFTMIYAFFGVPMFLVALIDIGAFAQYGITIVIDKIGQRCSRRKNKVEKPKEKEKTSRCVALYRFLEFFCTMLAFAAFILIGATILPIWEDHLSLFSAIYYTFITITAIGLGDIVPQNMTYLPLTLIYIILGLWMALIVTEQIADLFKLVHFAGRTLTGVKDLKVWIGGNKVTVGHFIDAVGARAGVPEHVMNDINWDQTVNEVAAGITPTMPDPPLVMDVVETPVVHALNRNVEVLPSEPKL